MTNTILKPNAIPIYAFLSFIEAKQLQGDLGDRIKILDCGAGGPVPPLALFSEHGFDAYGIDISDQQLNRARQYCAMKGTQIDFRKGDIRQIPFADESFDCVYEHYSMCHLSKKETAQAIREMHRVTRRKGLCFLGVISMDSWPKSLYGEEREPGEYWAGERAEGDRHSMFTDQEADQLVTGWEVLSKEKRVIYLLDEAEQLSEETWMGLYAGADVGCTEEEWRVQYDQRVHMVNYTHIYTILRKR